MNLDKDFSSLSLGLAHEKRDICLKRALVFKSIDILVLIECTALHAGLENVRFFIRYKINRQLFFQFLAFLPLSDPDIYAC